MPTIRRYDEGPTRIALLIAFLISFILLVSQRGGPNFTQPAQRKAEDVISPMAQFLSQPIRGAENFVFGFKDRNRAYEENIALRRELDQMRDTQSQFDLLQLKVKRYERILSSNADTDVPLKKIVARAVSENNGPFVRSLLLNTGRKNGVSVGNPVMTPDGLIGHVIDAGQKSSRVLQLGDLNSRIPVFNPRSEGKAILSGDNSQRPLLSFIQDKGSWQDGDVIITSGDDGMLPMGLPVGVVVQSNSQDIRVKLHAEDTPIDWVWVSPYQPIIAPSETDAAETEAGQDIGTDTNTETEDRP